MNSKSSTKTLPGQKAATAGMDWNLTELLARLDNDREFLSELLVIFRQDSRAGLQAAEDALAKQDFPTLERSAHTLKGMFRNLVMDRAAELASELELVARQGNSQPCASLLNHLREALEGLLPEVDAQIPEVKT